MNDDPIYRRSPTAAEITLRDRERPGFLDRHHRALLTLYNLRRLRRLVAELPERYRAGANNALDEIEAAAVEEPLAEWFYTNYSEQMAKAVH